jgi:hypothetical protein
VFSYPIALVSALWIGFVLVASCLPVYNPVNSNTANYTPAAVGVVLVFALGFWVVGIRTWFTEPAGKMIPGAPSRSSLCD